MLGLLIFVSISQVTVHMKKKNYVWTEYNYFISILI